MSDSNNSQSGCQSKCGVIYLITNTLNGKMYVGQTRQKLSSRIYGHKSNKGKSAIDVAIRKYGWENFTVEVLETCAKISEAVKAALAQKKLLKLSANHDKILIAL
ncbi:MAG: GIY-YIG nuclease family protein [Selenomonadaceae bacterium]|nr:GIY-YIG nuclease family protein [Selenomonadaceae bacterium]MBQ7723865.1 GIY-YIG nuclease family protein [Selenomonadaceae bacterium]